MAPTSQAVSRTSTRKELQGRRESGSYFAARCAQRANRQRDRVGLSRASPPRLPSGLHLAVGDGGDAGARQRAPLYPEAREGYFNVTGPWGSATIAETFGGSAVCRLRSTTPTASYGVAAMHGRARTRLRPHRTGVMSPVIFPQGFVLHTVIAGLKLNVGS